MATSFLDKTGLGTLWTKIKSTFALKSEIPDSTSDLTNDSGFITSIPPATTSTLGGVIVGTGLSVTSTGLVSLNFATEADIEEMLSANGLNATIIENWEVVGGVE